MHPLTKRKKLPRAIIKILARTESHLKSKRAKIRLYMSVFHHWINSRSKGRPAHHRSFKAWKKRLLRTIRQIKRSVRCCLISFHPQTSLRGSPSFTCALQKSSASSITSSWSQPAKSWKAASRGRQNKLRTLSLRSSDKFYLVSMASYWKCLLSQKEHTSTVKTAATKGSWPCLTRVVKTVALYKLMRISSSAEWCVKLRPRYPR